jgi:acyl carrier protein
MQVKEKVRQYILKNYLFSSDESALKDDVSLMQAGIIDSTGVLELIMFLEEQVGLKVADEEMTPENLDSVDRIVAFVGRKS